ncbi:MAG: DUF599 domain-containing protein [Burkholderiales bacterium]
MNAWWAVVATLLILVAYELLLAWLERHRPQHLARTVNARLREDWFAAVSAQVGSEVLAVQTLRNSVMSATMIATTAALGLMGTVTLAAPILREQMSAWAAGQGMPSFSVQLALELVLIGLLFGALVASTMAVRFYNHAGFVCSIPVGSRARHEWTDAGRAYVRRAGLLYSWGLRHLILVVPILVALLHTAAGPVAALLVVGVLWQFDRHKAPSA